MDLSYQLRLLEEPPVAMLTSKAQREHLPHLRPNGGSQMSWGA